MSDETPLERADRLEAEGRHDELVGQLIELLESEADPAQRFALYLRASATLEGPLGSPDNALMVSLQAFEEFPDDGHFGELLARQAETAGEWHRVLAAYENACETWQAEPGTAATFHRRLAGWYALQGENTEVLRHRLTLNELAPDDRANEDALIDLLEDAGEWGVVAELWKGRLAQAEGADEQAAARQRLVELYEGRLNEPAAALALVVQAFEADPDDAQAGELARLAERAEGWAAVYAAYEAACERFELDPERAEPFHVRLAGWYDLTDQDAAATPHKIWLAQRNPDDPAQQRELARLFEAQGRWADLKALLCAQLPHIADAPTRTRMVLRIAQILEEKLQDPHEAFDLLGRVYVESLDGGLEMHLEHLADRHGMYKALARIYRRALDRTFTDVSEAATLHLKAATIYGERLGDVRRAADQYAMVLEYDPGNERALKAIGDLFQAEGRWAELAEVRRREAESPAESGVRYQRWLDLGDLYRDHLGDHIKAVEAWFQAQQIRPDTPQVLLRLLDAYRATDRWEASIKVLRKLAKREEDPGKKAKYLYAVGIIQRDKIEDHYVAVRTLDQALEVDPTLVRAFQAIDEILTADHDHARQDRYYRKMLVRARQHRLDDALVVSLARNLGEINRSRLHNYAEAIKAYRIVAKKRPGDRAVHTLLSELHALEGDHSAAVKEAFELVRIDPTDPAGYRELARRRLDAGQLDGAWCACQALMVLGQANADERRFYEEGKRHSTAQAQRPLEAGDWALLTWAGRSQAIDRVLLATHEITGPLLARTPKALGLHPRKDALDLDAPSDLGQILKYTQQITGITVSSAWLSPTTVGLGVADLWPPGLLVAPDMASAGFADAAARGARALYLASVQHVLASGDPDPVRARQRVLGVLAAALAVVAPQLEVPADPHLVAALSKLSAGRRADLEAAVPGLPQPMDQGAEGWFEAVEHTASRLALLVSCDLPTVVRLIRDEPHPLVGDAATRLRALLLFAVSPPYIELRKRLGLNVPER